MSKGAMLAILGGLVGVVSAFMPWYSFDLLDEVMTFKAWGTNTGYVLLVAAVLAALFAAMGSKKGSKLFYGLALLAGLLIGLIFMANNPSGLGYDSINTLVGWLTLASTLLILLGSVMGLATKR